MNFFILINFSSSEKKITFYKPYLNKKNELKIKIGNIK